MPQQKIAVFGLGSMGFGSATALLRAGHKVRGVDVNEAAMARFSELGGNISIDPAELDAVVIVVLNAQQTENVLFGADGIVSKLRKGAVVIACATVPPEFAIDMASQCGAAGVHYLDAPISGGSVKAAEGALTMMCSGTPAAFDAASPMLEAMAEKVFRLGNAAGAGSAMKAANQLLAGVHIATMAEALTFGMTQGIAPDQFLDVISQCAGTSWMLENRAPHIVAGDYTPHSAVNIWPKDLGIVGEIAKAAGFDAPIARTALAQFQAAADAGLGQEDDAAVAKIYARQAGLKLPGES